MVPVLLLANLLLASRPYQSQPQRVPASHRRPGQYAKRIGMIATARQMTRQQRHFEDYTNNNNNDDPIINTNNTIMNHYLLQRFRKFRTTIHHAPQIERIYLLSDLHCDYASNRNWLRSICCEDDGSKDDDKSMILIAGDVSHNLSILEWTFVTLKCKFHEVGFVFGNHDVWLDKPKKHRMQISTKLDSDDVNENDDVTTDKTNVNLPVIVKVKGDGCVDSIDKLEKILELCRKHNVRYGPVKIQDEQSSSSLYVIPLLSWYHSSFDTEPSIRGWGGIPSARNVVADYKRAVWPSPLIDNREKNDDSILAQFMDDLNDVLFDYNYDSFIQSSDVEKKSNSISILTYSHFLPRIELLPEKRYLTLPTLHSCVGSTYLEERLRNIHHHCHNHHSKQFSRQYKNNNTTVLPMQLQQHLHAFGHSHLAWDQTIDNVRYVHVPLAYPKEWEQRRRSLEIGTMVIGKDGTDNDDDRFPVCIWERPSEKENNDTTSSTTNIGFPGEWLGGWWSKYYHVTERRPYRNWELAPWAAKRYRKLEGGLIEDFDHAKVSLSLESQHR